MMWPASPPTQEQGIGARSKVYQLYIANIARISNAVVIIADADGAMVLYADGSGDAIQDGWPWITCPSP